jgi:XRE family aerobic/anaerobic benzoate catabolism transcriptional regulator
LSREIVRPASSRNKRKKNSRPARRPLLRTHSSKLSSITAYLLQIGERIRSVRERRGFTQRQLAKQCSLSLRSLVSVEQGRAGLTLARLHTLAHALDVPIESLATEGTPASPAFEQSTTFLKKLPPIALERAHKLLLAKFGGANTSLRRFRIALIGLRGAGKSTLGSLLAQILQCPFIELDKQIEADSGQTLTIIFDLYGEAGYRRMEREALERILSRHRRFVLATGGGIVSDPTTYNRLLGECFTVWLRAKPEEHMKRVLKQGDRRPIAQSRQAMRDLHRILRSREALYRQADAVLDTSGQTIKQSLQSLALLLRQTSP